MTRIGTVKERVSRGVEFMQAEYGKFWLRKINPETLALKDGIACVLGQVGGEYNKTREDLRLTQEEAIALGFDKNKDSDYPKLTILWKQHILKLQKLFKLDK